MIACWTIFILAGVCQLGASELDEVAKQLPEYLKKHQKSPPLTTDAGNPLDSCLYVLSIGEKGPMVFDHMFMENMARINRERIPERIVHSKGSGAFGYFEVTHDITKYTKAKPFEQVGKKTPIAIRFSLAVADRGGAETIRDTRGMAIKFYTADGIWDIVGNGFPVFFFRDPSTITHFAHSTKRNPRTNIRDNTPFWDFFTSKPETIHTLLYFFSDRGIPDGYRYMDGFGVNTFTLVNHKNDLVYARFHFSTNQGVKNLFSEQALNLTAVDPDYATRDLYNAIENGEYPSWTFYMQVMPTEDAANYRWNPFDPTKMWYYEDYPLIPVGKLVLNRNPKNYFAEVEQLAFCPANLIPGIAPSMDKVLQGRMFAYADTLRYRLGTNYFELPVNSPRQWTEVHTYTRDGQMLYFNQGDAPSYYPNSFNGPHPVPSAAIPEINVTGIVKRWNLADDDNFSQARIYWKGVKPDEKERTMDNIVELAKTIKPPMQMKVVRLFQNVDETMALKIAQKLNLGPAALKPKQKGS